MRHRQRIKAVINLDKLLTETDKKLSYSDAHDVDFSVHDVRVH